MFELCDNLIGIYKTYNCTKSITIDPRKYDKREDPVIPVNRYSQNYTNGEVNVGQSNKNIENKNSENNRNIELSQNTNTSNHNIQSSECSITSEATERVLTGSSNSLSEINSLSSQSNTAEQSIEGSFQNEAMEVDC